MQRAHYLPVYATARGVDSCLLPTTTDRLHSPCLYHRAWLFDVTVVTARRGACDTRIAMFLRYS